MSAWQVKAWKVVRHLKPKHAPLDWLMKVNRMPLIMIFAAFAVRILVMLPVHSAVLAEVRVGVGAVLCLVMLCTAVLLGRHTVQRADIEMSIATGVIMLTNAMFGLGDTFADNANYRARSQGIALVVYKAFPPIFGFPLLSGGILCIWSSMIDFASVVCGHWYFNDPIRSQMHVTSVQYTLIGIIVTWMNSNRMHSVFESQQALAAEKALMDQLLMMMCDAILFLSNDGKTVVRTDDRLEMIIGRHVTGEDVDTWITHDEWDRLQEALLSAMTSPVLLPTTLISNSGARIQVEMFIVGNRTTNHADGTVPAFLIGVRTVGEAETFSDLVHLMAEDQSDTTLDHGGASVPQHGSATIQNSELNMNWADQDGEDHQSISALSATRSVPRSTATGRIFDGEDRDRQLEGTQEDQADELKNRLERVALLGRSERWLISSAALQLNIGQVLGAGGFGSVIGGVLHGSSVAVKSMKNLANSGGLKHLVSILTEVRILRHVRHPNVVVFYGTCVQPELGTVQLVMERIDGQDLHKYVVGHSSDSEVHGRFQLLKDIACAMRHLHAQEPQIIHGDLKAANIMVEPRIPRAKLLDFGLSRLLTHGARPLGGTLAWMAPEIVCGRAKRPDPSADVFSFGRVTYLVVTCRRPLEGLTRNAIMAMAKHRATDVLIWRADKPLNEESRQLCERLCRFLPEERPSMAQAHEELSSWVIPDFQDEILGSDLSRPSCEDKAGGTAKAGPADRTALTRVVRTLLAVPGFALSWRNRPVQQGQPSDTLEGADGMAAGNAITEPGGTLAVVSHQEPLPQPSHLLLPHLRPTSMRTKKIVMMEALMQFNISVLPGCCCTFHSAVAELRTISDELAQGNCRSFAPYFESQCGGCGMLFDDEPSGCPVCGQHDQGSAMPCIKEESSEGQSQTGRPDDLCRL